MENQNIAPRTPRQAQAKANGLVARTISRTWLPVLVVLLFLGALFWAKAKDPFKRSEFKLQPTGMAAVDGLVVLPKPISPRPVVILVQDTGESVLSSGIALRQIAELGMAAVAIDYNQTREASFERQMIELHRFLKRQPWAATNSIGWVGIGEGAQKLINFGLKTPELNPKAFTMLGGAWTSTLEPFEDASIHFPLHCPVLYLYPEPNATSTVADAERLAAVLRTNDVPTDFRILKQTKSNVPSDRALLLRVSGEFCRNQLLSERFSDYRSIALWEAGAKPLPFFLIPAALWIVVGLFNACLGKSTVKEKILVAKWEVPLRWLTGILVSAAIAFSVIFLVTPRLLVSDRTINIADKLLISSKAKKDYDKIKSAPIWQNQRLSTLLEHAELASYNRGLVNWQIDDKIYSESVLSPVINQESLAEMNWRGSLWEYFYPWIRKEQSPVSAAQTVVRLLRGRMTIDERTGISTGIENIWLRQVTNLEGFHLIYVSALRSVGIGARLSERKTAEIWDGKQWISAPLPTIIESLK